MPVVTRSTPASLDPAPASGQLAGAAEYFALLLEEAAAIEFEGPVVRARAAGVDAATLAGLEQVKLLALQVRDAFAARRRRESELAA
ncbi:MAG: diguanylate phosphodiesterase, partial [Actinomycetota bacterium]|nr:diguanylate phosphodiesterase [Actinomycetota bacterium]